MLFVCVISLVLPRVPSPGYSVTCSLLDRHFRCVTTGEKTKSGTKLGCRTKPVSFKVTDGLIDHKNGFTLDYIRINSIDKATARKKTVLWL